MSRLQRVAPGQPQRLQPSSLHVPRPTSLPDDATARRLPHDSGLRAWRWGKARTSHTGHEAPQVQRQRWAGAPRVNATSPPLCIAARKQAAGRKHVRVRRALHGGAGRARAERRPDPKPTKQGGDANTPVVTSADRNVKYEAVVKLMDSLQRAPSSASAS